MGNVAIDVRGVKKSFSLSRHKNDSLKRAITQMFKPKPRGVVLNALNEISFQIQKGDFFGVLGRMDRARAPC